MSVPIKIKPTADITTEDLTEHTQIKILKTDWNKILSAINNINFDSYFDMLSLLIGITIGFFIDIIQKHGIDTWYLIFVGGLWMLFFLIKKSPWGKYISHSNSENKTHLSYLKDWTKEINDRKKELVSKETGNHGIDKK